MLKIKCHVHLFQRENFFLPSATGTSAHSIRKNKGENWVSVHVIKIHLRTTSPFTRNLPYICRSYNVKVVPSLPEGTNTEIQILKFNIGI